MADEGMSKKHLLIPANALERISRAAQELGWDMGYCTDDTGEKVIGITMGESAYVASMMGDDGEHECEHDGGDGEGEVKH